MHKWHCRITRLIIYLSIRWNVFEWKWMWITWCASYEHKLLTFVITRPAQFGLWSLVTRNQWETCGQIYLSISLYFISISGDVCVFLHDPYGLLEYTIQLYRSKKQLLTLVVIYCITILFIFMGTVTTSKMQKVFSSRVNRTWSTVLVSHDSMYS